METPKPRSFLDNALYQDPKGALKSLFGNLKVPPDIRPALEDYLAPFLGDEGTDPSDPAHQTKIKPILEHLVQSGQKEKAGLLFNLHRTFTEFEGYGGSAAASEDVEACFGKGQEIPAEGVIIVDHFVTRNLPAIVKHCEKRRIDLSRIKVRVPQAILAAQLMGMDEAKRAEFEEAAGKLDASQFIALDVDHVQDIGLPSQIAVLFSPRTAAIYPKLHAENEGETVENYRSWFRDKVNRLVDGGHLFINVAKLGEHKPLTVETNEEDLTKLSVTVSEKVTAALTQDSYAAGLARDAEGTFVLDNYDHKHMIERFHVRKPTGKWDRFKMKVKGWAKKWVPFY